MSFLKEIDQYIEQIRKALSHGSRIDINKIKDINRIYDDLRVQESIEIYGRQKSLNDLPKVDLSCGQCVKSMFEQIIIWHNKKSQPIVEFKGVPQKEVVEVVKDEVVKSFNTKDLHKYVDPDLNAYEKTLYPKMKWGEFKTYCKEQGLNTKGKKRTELEEELKTL